MAGSLLLLLLGLPSHAASPGHHLGSAVWPAASIYWLLAVSRQHKGFSLFSKPIQLSTLLSGCMSVEGILFRCFKSIISIKLKEEYHIN